MKIRLFLAIEISPEAKQNIAHLVETLRTGITFTGANPTWIKPEAMHLTIKFLGWTDDEMIPRIAEGVRRAVANVAPFTFSVRGVGVFPNARLPRVIWTGVRKADEELQDLFQRIEWEMAALGFEREEREFHPHLTLARQKSTKGSVGLMKVVEQHSREYCGETTANQIILFKSDLQPSGAVYTALQSFAFEGKPITRTNTD